MNIEVARDDGDDDFVGEATIALPSIRAESSYQQTSERKALTWVH